MYGALGYAVLVAPPGAGLGLGGDPAGGEGEGDGVPDGAGLEAAHTAQGYDSQVHKFPTNALHAAKIKSFEGR